MTENDKRLGEESTLVAQRCVFLQNQMGILDLIAYAAKTKYMVTSQEVGVMLDVKASAVTSKGDEFVYRNWKFSRVTAEGNQILWSVTDASREEIVN